jgi:hypothetical protein
LPVESTPSSSPLPVVDHSQTPNPLPNSSNAFVDGILSISLQHQCSNYLKR